jgi:hypothetical protein
VEEVDEGSDVWTFLENGIKIQFIKAEPNTTPHYYRTGDYWLIPARTITGDIDWPKDETKTAKPPLPCPPHGIQHYYAPLAVITDSKTHDCRRLFCSLANIYPYGDNDGTSCQGIGTDVDHWSYDY